MAYEFYEDPAFSLTSLAFAHEDDIPVEYTCDGAARSPALAWRAAPAGTKSFVLIVHDPESTHGDFTHWVLFNIPGDCEEFPASDGLGPADIGIMGRNQSGTVGYAPPCPPAGDSKHSYTFMLLAVDRLLDLEKGATRQDVEDAALPHTLSIASFTGLYARAPK